MESGNCACRQEPFLGDMKMFEALVYSPSFMLIREFSGYENDAVNEVNFISQGFQFKTHTGPQPMELGSNESC